eukprot:gene5287-3152_t
MKTTLTRTAAERTKEEEERAAALATEQAEAAEKEKEKDIEPLRERLADGADAGVDDEPEIDDAMELPFPPLPVAWTHHISYKFGCFFFINL